MNSEYQIISISNSDGSMYVGHTIYINNTEVVEAIERLFNDGCNRVEKTNNTINFLIWTKLMDFGSGIAFSTIEHEKPVLPCLTKLEPLSEENWYYYEEDCNE